MQTLGLSKQSMSDWVRDGCVPIKHCPAVAKMTRMKLERLNPAFDVRALKPAKQRNAA